MVNSLKLYEDLKEAHFTEPQARLLVQAWDQALEERTSSLDKSLAGKVGSDIFDAAMHRLDSKIDEKAALLGSQIQALGATIDARVAEAKGDLVRWMVGLLLAQTALLVSLGRLIR
jgi:hypothetical protein